MESLRRPFVAVSFAALVALGCGPSVQMLTGASPGVSSVAYLSSATPAMVIEVTPTTGHDPSTQALDLLMARANEHCNKPSGITLQVDPEVPIPVHAGTHQWSLAELNAFEQAHAKLQSTSGQAVLNIFYLDGGYAENPAAIALSYTGHSIAFFQDMLAPGGPEGSALVHELGHQMGLVNGTTRMVTPHQDVAHGLHDVSPSCIMYFSLDPQNDGLAPVDYCDNCKADLQAAGGK